jgi:hypothetical protein
MLGVDGLLQEDKWREPFFLGFVDRLISEFGDTRTYRYGRKQRRA